MHTENNIAVSVTSWAGTNFFADHLQEAVMPDKINKGQSRFGKGYVYFIFLNLSDQKNSQLENRKMSGMWRLEIKLKL